MTGTKPVSGLHGLITMLYRPRIYGMIYMDYVHLIQSYSNHDKFSHARNIFQMVMFVTKKLCLLRKFDQVIYVEDVLSSVPGGQKANFSDKSGAIIIQIVIQVVVHRTSWHLYIYLLNFIHPFLIHSSLILLVRPGSQTGGGRDDCSLGRICRGAVRRKKGPYNHGLKPIKHDTFVAW